MRVREGAESAQTTALVAGNEAGVTVAELAADLGVVAALMGLDHEDSAAIIRAAAVHITLTADALEQAETRMRAATELPRYDLQHDANESEPPFMVRVPRGAYVDYSAMRAALAADTVA